MSNLHKEFADTLIGSLGEKNLPRNTYYGDGSPIEPDVLDTIRAAYEQTKIKFTWQRNDLLLLDNMLFTHGRESYTGPRKVLTGMAGPNVQASGRGCRPASGRCRRKVPTRPPADHTLVRIYTAALGQNGSTPFSAVPLSYRSVPTSCPTRRSDGLADRTAKGHACSFFLVTFRGLIRAWSSASARVLRPRFSRRRAAAAQQAAGKQRWLRRPHRRGGSVLRRP